MRVRGFIWVIGVLLLAGCKLLEPVPVKESRNFTLRLQPMQQVTQAEQTHRTLLLAAVTAAPAVASSQIAYTKGNQAQINYFAYNRWVDTPADMLQNVLTQAFAERGNFNAVVAAPFAGKADLRLNVHIQTFQQEFADNNAQSTAHVELMAQLTDEKTQRIIASKRFSVQEAAAAATPEAGVNALNQAVTKLAGQLIAWTVQYNQL